MDTLSIILVSLIPGLIGFPLFFFYYMNGEVDKEKLDWFIILQYTWRALLFACIWPLMIVIYILAEITDRNQKVKHAVQEMTDAIEGKFIRPGKLSFIYGMGGKGVFSCKKCGYQEEIVSFLHGFGEDRWSNTGYQCQKCGKFHAIEYAHKLKELPRCECGGGLSNEMEVFCPVCRTDQVGYCCTLMT